jgi:hypothetical protein
VSAYQDLVAAHAALAGYWPLTAASSTPADVIAPERGQPGDYYTFVVTTGGTLTIKDTGSGYDSYGYLFDSAGTLLTSNDDSNGAGRWLISATLGPGRYFILHTPFSAGRGPYTLRLDPGTAVVSATPGTAAFRSTTAAAMPPSTDIAGTISSSSSINIPDVKNGNNAGVAGTVTAGNPGRIAGDPSFFFDGTTGYLTIPTTAALRALVGVWTVEVIIRPKTGFGGAIITPPYPLGNNALGPVVGWYTDNVVLSPLLGGGIYTGSTWDFFTGLSLPIDEWHHVAVTRDASNIKLYLDGVLQASRAVQQAAVAQTNTAGTGHYVGRRWDGTGAGNQYGGYMQHLAMYNAALSASDIADHVAAMGADPGGFTPVTYEIATMDFDVPTFDTEVLGIGVGGAAVPTVGQIWPRGSKA